MKHAKRRQCWECKEIITFNKERGFEYKDVLVPGQCAIIKNGITHVQEHLLWNYLGMLCAQKAFKTHKVTIQSPGM